MTTQRGEAARKAIHVGVSLVAAAVVWWLSPPAAAAVLAGATLVALTVELGRRTSRGFAATFHRRLHPMLRPPEAGRLTGATTLSIGFTLAALLLPGRAAVAGILFAGVADAAAALIGRHRGGIRYPGGKSVGGSAAFLTVSALVAMWPIGLPLAPAVAVAVILTPLEALKLRLDDNLYLPLAGAAAVHGAAWLWGLKVFS